MNPTGGLLYKDQEAAENAASVRRWELISFLDELQMLNETLDSHKLHELIARERERLRAL